MKFANHKYIYKNNFRSAFAVLLWMMLYNSSAIFAQEVPASQPSTSSATTQPTAIGETAISEITGETIQARISQIEATTEISEQDKTEILGLYKKAAEQIELTKNWRTQIEKYERGRQEAPDLLIEVRKRIDTLTTQPATQPALDIPPDATLEQANTKLLEAEANLKAQQDLVKNLDDESKTRMRRKSLIPDLLNSSKQRLEKMEADMTLPLPSNIVPQLAQARRTLLMSQKQAIEQEIKAHQEEILFYEVRSDLLTVRREEANRLLSQAQSLVKAWEAKVSEKRKEDLEREREKAEQKLRQAPPRIRDLAEQNAKLIAKCEEIDTEIDSLENKTKTVQALTEELNKDFEFLQNNIEQTERSDLGPLMRKSRTKLYELRVYGPELRVLNKKHAQVRLQVWELEEEWLIPIEKSVNEVLESLRKSDKLTDFTDIEPEVRELFKSRRTSLEQAIKFYGTYESRLRELIAAESALVAKIGEFAEFIEKHVLWIRSAGPIYKLAFPKNWHEIGDAFGRLFHFGLADLRGYYYLYVLVVVVLVLLFLYRPMSHRRLREISGQVTRAISDSYRFTLLALAYTFCLALPWAFLLWFGAWRIGFIAQRTEGLAYVLCQAVANGLRLASLILLGLQFIRYVCQPKGLGEAHFRWNAKVMRLMRLNIYWLTTIVVPMTLVVCVTEKYSEDVWRDSGGRIAFVIGMCALAIFAHRMLRPKGALVASQFRKSQNRLLYDLRYLWYFVTLFIPILLAIASLFGYHYTALRFLERIGYTILLVLGFVFFHAMMVRWLFVTQRRLSIEQMKKKRAAAVEEQTSDKQPGMEVGDGTQVELDIVSINEQTGTLLRSIVAFGLVLGLWLIWSGMLPALSFMEKVELGRPGDASAGKDSNGYITLAHLAISIVVVAATLILAKNIPGLLEITILQKLPLDTGGRYAFTTLVRYVITVIGIIIAFNSIGIGWSKVQWLIAAVTVGLGFGLQEIFANFISGLMILFERPIRVGDTITVGNVSGTVSRIRIRATTITGWDRKELVIPNKEFITGQVINWTLSDSTLRIIIPVGIAYGSDTTLAREVLYRIAREHTKVLDEPEPRVLFMGFGDSTLNFEIRVYVASVDHYLGTIDELNNAIDQEFRKAGIEIAFPQRDLHVRTIKDVFPISDKRDKD
ncbi:MAG: mechanosensitive ion channel [Planctomycetota bacterium]|nr:MAG: mechanosensitive ion channel [Planctomycetota bacterium]